MKTEKNPEQWPKRFWPDGPPDGPWLSEPDRAKWTTPNGLTGLVVRVGTGALCGYVGLPSGHRLYRVHYMSLPDVNVHGGLTYSGWRELQPADGSPAPADGFPSEWYLGFDCAHFGDLVPLPMARVEGGTYRTFDWAVREVNRLSAQLARAPEQE